MGEELGLHPHGRVPPSPVVLLEGIILTGNIYFRSSKKRAICSQLVEMGFCCTPYSLNDERKVGEMTY